MILTLTPNPSIDRTVSLAGELMRGQVQRVDSVTSQGGGKGVNISRASVSAGQPTLAVLPAAKDDPFVIELLAAGIDCRPVRPAGDVRVNITITEPDGTTTKLNSPGATVEQVHLDAMSDALMARAGTADWAVLAGSLPPGAPPEFYADVVRRLRGTVAKVAVDTSEAPLRALVDALPASAPHLMKPNGEELASFTGGDAEELEGDPRLAAAAARTLVDRGVEAVLATLGGNGAVLVTARAPGTPLPTDHRREHGWSRRLEPVRLRPGRHPRAHAAPTPRPRRGLRQRRRCPARHHDPRAVAPPHRARHRHRLGRHRMTDLITRELVRLDTTWGDDKLDVIRGLAAVVDDAGRAADTEQLIADAFAREETSSTGLPGGIAIPHCRTTVWRSPRWPSPACVRGWTSAPRTAPPTWRS